MFMIKYWKHGNVVLHSKRFAHVLRRTLRWLWGVLWLSSWVQCSYNLPWRQKSRKEEQYKTCFLKNDQADAMLFVLRKEKNAITSQEKLKYKTTRKWEGKDTSDFLDSRKRCCVNILHFVHIRHKRQNCRINTSALFWATEFGAICYNSSRKRIQQNKT